MLSLYSLALLSLVLFTGCGSQSRNADSSDSAQAPAAEAQREEAAQLAPPIELDDLNGKHFSLGALKGQVVFLDFWATWCPPCLRSVPEVMKLEADYEPKGVVIASLSLDDDVAALRRFVADKGMRNQVIAASGTPTPERWRIRSIPRFFIIDREGRIAEGWEGFDPSMVEKWRSTLDRLLKT